MATFSRTIVAFMIVALCLATIFLYLPRSATCLNDDDGDLQETFCTSCPHPRFIEKHLCRYCTNLDHAATFSTIAILRHPSIRNTVFFGTPSFHVKTYIKSRCGNSSPAAAAVCELTFDDSHYLPFFKCKYLGKFCYGEHSTDNGHLHYEEIRC